MSSSSDVAGPALDKLQLLFISVDDDSGLRDRSMPLLFALLDLFIELDRVDANELDKDGLFESSVA